MIGTITTAVPMLEMMSSSSKQRAEEDLVDVPRARDERDRMTSAGS